MKQENDYECLPQYLSALAISLSSCMVGGWMAWTSVAIPKMMNITTSDSDNNTAVYTDDDPISIDLHQGSWIASLFFIGNIVGCLAGGYINQKLGTRKVYLISAPISALTWIMVALATDLWMILVSRVISGIMFGFFQANGKVYNAEIAHPDLRGSLGTILGNMFSLGSIYTYVTGYFIHSWRIIAWLQVIPCILMGIFVFFVPDSPYWLIEKGRYQEAQKSLTILRGSNYDINDEYQEILNKKRQKEAKGRTVLQTLCSRIFFIPFLRIGSLMIITQWAGINVITAYMVNIFIQSGSSVEPGLAAILVCSVQQCLATCSTAVLRVSPRKPLFIICASGIAVAQASMGTYSYLTRDLDQAGDYGWIPLACVISLNAFRTVGFMVVIQLVLAESFPTEIRLEHINIFLSSFITLLQSLCFWYLRSFHSSQHVRCHQAVSILC